MSTVKLFCIAWIKRTSWILLVKDPLYSAGSIYTIFLSCFCLWKNQLGVQDSCSRLAHMKKHWWNLQLHIWAVHLFPDAPAGMHPLNLAHTWFLLVTWICSGQREPAWHCDLVHRNHHSLEYVLSTILRLEDGCPRSGQSAPGGRTVRACAEQIRVPSFVLRLLAKITGKARKLVGKGSSPPPL
jgi:hypothetical protein